MSVDVNLHTLVPSSSNTDANLLECQHVHAIVGGENMEDFISHLQDDILISILTCLPIKEAVRTSVLSKRWRNLYKFVSTINFCCRDLVKISPYVPGQYLDVLSAFPPHDSKLIFDRVHGFLQLHSGSIRSFVCQCCLTKAHAHIFEQCIYSLGKLGIERLLLAFCCKNWHSDLPFSCHLLSCMPSLKHFELRFCSLLPDLRHHCNSLKTLILSRVRVLPGSLECILCNCLSLYSMMIDYCELPSKLCFCGPNLQLKSLVIHVDEGVEEIEFYASNLITFEFYNPQMVNFIFDYVPKLQSFYLSLFNENVMSYVCGRLGKDLPHLKSLVFNTEEDFFQESSIRMGINMFSSLKRLELSLSCMHQINLLSLTPLLHNCPLLQEFHLATNLLEYNGPQVEKCVVLHSQLKNVYISGFGGTKNEIDFALYILKSAAVLQKIHISRHANNYLGFGKWVERERTPLKKKMCRNIRKQLKQQAVSRTVHVIIRLASRIKWEMISNEQFTEQVVLMYWFCGILRQKRYLIVDLVLANATCSCILCAYTRTG